MTRNNALIFPIAAVTTLLHLLRNLTSVYYILYGLILAICLICSLRYIENRSFQNTTAVIALALFYVIACSLITGSTSSILVGVMRLFYLSPLVIYFYSRDFDSSQSLLFWKIVFFFIIFSSLSVIIQYFTGPIAWFAESSERAGTYRYASLAGSLTVFGSIVGIGLIQANVFIRNKALLICTIGSLFFGAIVALQKMSFLSVAIAIVIVLTFKARQKGSLRFVYNAILWFPIFIGATFAVLHVLSNYFPEHLQYASLIFTSDAASVYDISVTESASDRLTALPAAAISHWGTNSLLLGVGVFGGSGGLGYPELPMAHNLVIETCLIFGIFVGALIILYITKYAYVAIRLIMSYDDPRILLAASAFLILCITSIFSGGLFYQPVTGLIFWFSLSELNKFKRHVRI